MPKELPGFYYDAEKNRYFPIKGPIPGSSRASSSSYNTRKPASKRAQASKFCRRSRARISNLLQDRELNGSIINFNKRKCSFTEELLKTQASQPMVWKYQGTENTGDGALDQMHIDINTLEGQTQVDVLITGSISGSLSLFEVGKVGQHFDNGAKCIPDRVGPVYEENNKKCNKVPGDIWQPSGASLQMSSSISCIKLCGKHSAYAVDDSSSIQHALVTTLGSETSGGSVCILNLAEPLDLYSRTPLSQTMHEITSFNCTIWAADYNHNTSQVVIGTNFGAALVNLETGIATWTCRSKSDVLAQQLHQSGNVALCGLRNGAIVTVDVREKREGFSSRLIKHRIPCSSFGKFSQNSKQWFELKGNIYPSCTLYMPSSICCLKSLQSYDQYFLASSMDGSIKLYDHRMTKRGAVQSYEGHVNSHTRLQLGVDRSERFLMAGGEDRKLRLWSIKSGELLFEEKYSDSVLSTVCWQRAKRCARIMNENERYEDCLSGGSHSWGTWCGSLEGLFYVHLS